MTVDQNTIIQLILALGQVAKDVAPLVAQGQVVFTTSDAAKIKEALGNIQDLSDATFERVQAKLGD